MSDEIWLPVSGFESRFKISSHGRLLSINGKFGGERVLTTHIDKMGYMATSLRSKPLHRRCRVHTIVAEEFITKPNGATCVNHKDGNKLNNHIDNLEWVTIAENTQHAFRTGLADFNGAKSVHAKLTDKDVMLMRNLYKNNSRKVLGKIFGVSARHVEDIVKGVCWTHLPILDYTGRTKPKLSKTLVYISTP